MQEEIERIRSSMRRKPRAQHLLSTDLKVILYIHVVVVVLVVVVRGVMDGGSGRAIAPPFKFWIVGKLWENLLHIRKFFYQKCKNFRIASLIRQSNLLLSLSIILTQSQFVVDHKMWSSSWAIRPIGWHRSVSLALSQTPVYIVRPQG